MDPPHLVKVRLHANCCLSHVIAVQLEHLASGMCRAQRILLTADWASQLDRQENGDQDTGQPVVPPKACLCCCQLNHQA